MALSEIIRSGKLTFAGSHKTGEPIRFSTLTRAREPVSRSKAGVQGKVADVHHENAQERDAPERVEGTDAISLLQRCEGGARIFHGMNPFTSDCRVRGESGRVQIGNVP